MHRFFQYPAMSPVIARIFVIALSAGLWGGAYPGAAGAASVTAALQSQPEDVGLITMTLGQAHIFRPDGSRRSARQGNPVWVGDRIETAAGGHVHIRFVDDGLVSVRPNSRLVIEDYRYDSQQVQQSLVRFRLDHGVARSISGAAAEGARERFRLNTPLAVIGVRGTDFVVQTDAQQTQALVNQGAVIMAPLAAPDCQVRNSGPCGGPAARLLSAADMPGMLMQYRGYFDQPQLLRQDMAPWDGATLLAKNTSAEPVPATRQLQPAIAHLSSSATGQQEVLTVLAQDTVQQAFKDVPSIGAPKPDTSVPVAPVPVPPEAVALAWGRWAQQEQVAGDISQLRELARQGRSVTVGNNVYVLYRKNDTPSVLGPALGRFDMSLQAAQASFQPTGASFAQAAQVQGGVLTLDFAAQRFDTQLQLSAPALGAHTLKAGGSLNNDGLFNQRSPGLSLGGAVALDGKTAGYFFDKSVVGTGHLSGITSWGR